jgi:hypothetical protein
MKPPSTVRAYRSETISWSQNPVTEFTTTVDIDGVTKDSIVIASIYEVDASNAPISRSDHQMMVHNTTPNDNGQILFFIGINSTTDLKFRLNILVSNDS